MLVIENKSLMMQEVDLGDAPFGAVSGTKIYGVLGLIQIYPVSYLFVITGQKKIFEINYPETVRIFEITDTDLIVLNKEEGTENKEYVKAINKIMKCGFYYSPDADLTQRFMDDNDQTEDEWVKESADSQVNQTIHQFRSFHKMF